MSFRCLPTQRPPSTRVKARLVFRKPERSANVCLLEKAIQSYDEELGQAGAGLSRGAL